MCTGSATAPACRPYASYSASQLNSLSEYTVEYGWYPDFLLYWLAIWASYLLSQQQTVSLMLVVRSKYSAVLASVSLSILYLCLGELIIGRRNPSAPPPK